ncbi:hypothetical protein GYMLUDRAFT_788575 [Collybiopsis luxurians FD-317 M1]|nr:hypothetical protein GYMLUDRAFT_788575 [Collybiopsis luxurians FD-317 M1]
MSGNSARRADPCYSWQTSKTKFRTGSGGSGADGGIGGRGGDILSKDSQFWNHPWNGTRAGKF